MENIVEQIVYVRDFLSEHALFTIGFLLLVGYLFGVLAGKLKLPQVTGFIIAGLIMSPAVSGMVPDQLHEAQSSLTEIALGLIALTIGGEFYLVKLKKLGKEIIVITLVQLFATFLAVAFGLWIFKMPLPFALMLGAIASATAPAATVAIVQSLRAHGTFVDYLYGVVALDDAGAVILFGIVFAIGSSIVSVAGETAHTAEIIGHALLEVFLSIITGAISGLLIHFTTRKMKNKNGILILTLGFVFLTTAIAILTKQSLLLMNMTAGALIINLSPKNHRIFSILKPMTPPIYALFFIFAGAELDLREVFKPEVLGLGLVYIAFRSIGKYGGVYLGAGISKVSSSIKHYLGFCMLPQAGVALGLVLSIEASPIMENVKPEFRLIIATMRNIVLFSVFVNEIVGPPLSKMAIIKGVGLDRK